MDSDRRFDASDFDIYPPNPPVAIKSSWWKPALMLLVVLLASSALALSSLAVQRSTEQDKLRLLGEQRRVNERLIQGCDQFNLTRKIMYDSNQALAAIAIVNSPNPNEISPAIRQFLLYNMEANDPVSCDLNDPDFMKDTTPPTVPPIPEVELR